MGRDGIGRSRLRLLLASSSVAALLVGGGAPEAWAACAIDDVGNSLGPGPISNSSAINCISVQASTVSGNVSNIGPGGLLMPTLAGISISNNSTVTGAVINSGQIGVSGTPAGIGIFVSGNAFVAGGISNTGHISAREAGIFVGGVSASGSSVVLSTFAGGIGNSGSISASGALFGGGVLVGSVALSGASASVGTVSGGISNSGTISDGGGLFNNGILVGGIALGTPSSASMSAFAGGISNSGTVSAGVIALLVGGQAATGGSVVLSAFSGGIANSGSVSALVGILVGGQAFSGGSVMVSSFAGGVTNTGLVSAPAGGILIGGFGESGSITVGAFSGGVTNAGTISASNVGNGIVVGGRASSGGSVAIATFSGGITNSGTISRAMNGILVGGTALGFGSSVSISTFSGGISNSGMIIARNAGIFVGGSAASGARVTVATFLGGISNSGTISARNAGIFVGGVTSGGTLAISTFSGGITNSGTISVTGFSGVGIQVQDVQTFLGNIWNSGTISVPRGTGIFVCNCATLAGGSIVNTGTISAVEGIVVHNFSPVSIFDSGTIVGTSGVAVDLTGASGGNTFTLGPGYSISGDVLAFAGGGDTFQLDGTGSGSFDLSTIGSTRQYENFTAFNVVGGTWTVFNAFSQTQPWNVLGGTLAGTGTLSAVNVLGPGGGNPYGGGTLEPGNVGQPGTFMTITGNLTFQQGAAYLVNLSPTTASRANVAGAVFLNGIVEGVLTPGSYNKNTTYDILDPSSISGTFTGFTSLNAPGFGGTLTYNGNTDVLLNLTAQLGAGGGLNANQQNVADAINTYFNNGGTLPASFFPVFGLTGGNLANALSRLSGEAATGAETSAFQSMNEFLNLLLDPTSVGSGSRGGGTLGFAPEQASLPPEVALAYASILKAPPAASPPQPPHWTAWGAAYGGTSLTDGNAALGSNDVTAGDYGFAGGMEYHVDPSTLAGFALAGGGTNWNLANALGSGRSDTFQVGLYGKRYFGPAYVAGALAFADNWFTTNRTAFAGDQLTASFAGQSYAARLEGGYRFGLPAPAPGAIAGVTPYAALQTQWFHTPAYGETDLTGGGFGLTYNAMHANDTRSELGARVDDLTMLYGMPLITRGRLAWAHDWVSNPSLDAAFQTLPGASFIVYGAAPPADSALATAGAELRINTNWSLLGKFDGDFAPGSQTYAGSGTLRYTW